LYQWLIRLSVRVGQPEHIRGRVEDAIRVYAADLTRWPARLVESALDEWPSQSQWWPTWFELEAELNTRLNAMRPQPMSLPRPTAPEHVQLRGGEEHAPFTTRAEWDGFAASMRALRDMSRQMICRDALLRIGEKIEARQLLNAQRMGWA
jgi:hypothetical protein